MRVALDLEEVLADTIRESCNATGSLEREDFNSWDLSDHTWQVYSGVSDALWRHDPHSIPPVEDELWKTTDYLRAKCERLDIVTARLHVDGNIREWLDRRAIKYDRLISTRQPKYELDYDVFIDDNPEMAGECRLLLRDRPHNSTVNTEQYKSCDRIRSLKEGVKFING